MSLKLTLETDYILPQESSRHRALAIDKGEEDWSYHQTSCEHEDTDVFLELIHQ